MTAWTLPPLCAAARVAMPARAISEILFGTIVFTSVARSEVEAGSQVPVPRRLRVHDVGAGVAVAGTEPGLVGEVVAGEPQVPAFGFVGNTGVDQQCLGQHDVLQPAGRRLRYLV